MSFNFWGSTQASMLLSNFKSKLTQLDPRLVVKDNEVSLMRGFRVAGIYLKMQGQVGLAELLRGHSTEKIDKYFDGLASGQLDRHLCGVCIEWIPEHDIFNTDYSCITVPGWRSIVLRLVSTKIVPLDRARKVFDCSSLGESDYDRASYFNKLQIAKKIDGIINK